METRVGINARLYSRCGPECCLSSLHLARSFYEPRLQFGGIDHAQTGEVSAIEAPVAGQECVSLQPRMSANEKVRYDPPSSASTAGSVLAPKAPGQSRRLL